MASPQENLAAYDKLINMYRTDVERLNRLLINLPKDKDLDIKSLQKKVEKLREAVESAEKDKKRASDKFDQASAAQRLAEHLAEAPGEKKVQTDNRGKLPRLKDKTADAQVKKDTAAATFDKATRRHNEAKKNLKDVLAHMQTRHEYNRQIKSNEKEIKNLIPKLDKARKDVANMQAKSSPVWQMHEFSRFSTTGTPSASAVEAGSGRLHLADGGYSGAPGGSHNIEISADQKKGNPLRSVRKKASQGNLVAVDVYQNVKKNANFTFPFPRSNTERAELPTRSRTDPPSNLTPSSKKASESRNGRDDPAEPSKKTSSTPPSSSHHRVHTSTKSSKTKSEKEQSRSSRHRHRKHTSSQSSSPPSSSNKETTTGSNSQPSSSRRREYEEGNDHETAETGGYLSSSSEDIYGPS